MQFLLVLIGKHHMEYISVTEMHIHLIEYYMDDTYTLLHHHKKVSHINV